MLDEKYYRQIAEVLPFLKKADAPGSAPGARSKGIGPSAATAMVPKSIRTSIASAAKASEIFADDNHPPLKT